MPNNKKKDGFIMQAGILAIAGIIVRIIGLLYNSPMTALRWSPSSGMKGTDIITALTMLTVLFC